MTSTLELLVERDAVFDGGITSLSMALPLLLVCRLVSLAPVGLVGCDIGAPYSPVGSVGCDIGAPYSPVGFICALSTVVGCYKCDPPTAALV